MHRGAPGDTRTALGSDILSIGTSFFEITGHGPASSMIPYHRVLAIELDGEVVWERRAHDTPGP